LSRIVSGGSSSSFKSTSCNNRRHQRLCVCIIIIICVRSRNDYLFGGMCSGRSVCIVCKSSARSLEEIDPLSSVVAVIKTGRKFDIALLLWLLLLSLSLLLPHQYCKYLRWLLILLLTLCCLRCVVHYMGPGTWFTRLAQKHQAFCVFIITIIVIIIIIIITESGKYAHQISRIHYPLDGICHRRTII
jgi:hypothetical protein